MKVRIIKCSNPNFWYRDRIGNTLNVEEAVLSRWDDNYRVKESFMQNDMYMINKFPFFTSLKL